MEREKEEVTEKSNDLYAQREHGLLLGLDIQNAYSQICFYNQTTREPESVTTEQGNPLFFHKRPLQTVFAEETQIVEQLAQLLAELLQAAGTFTGVKTIQRLTLTVHNFVREELVLFQDAMKLLAIPEKRYEIISGEESFAFYAFQQKEELHAPGAMLFHYTGEKLAACYIQEIVQKNRKLLAEQDLVSTDPELLAVPKGQRTLLEAEELLTHFLNQALQGKHASAVYLTGDGFDTDQFPEQMLKSLCLGRKVFAGQNLFAKGACYSACLTAWRKDPDWTLACCNRITTGVETEILVQGQRKRLRIIRQGMNWLTAGRHLEFILEKPGNLVFTLFPVNHAPFTEKIDLSGLPLRESKTIRLDMDFAFTSEDRCMVTIRDLGFGELFPSSGSVISRQLRFTRESVEYAAPADSGGMEEQPVTEPAEEETQTTARLILCRQKRAEHPFLVPDTSKKLYSLEELCYYLYHNIYLINRSFIQDGLLTFIREETDNPSLADRITYLQQKDAGLAEILVLILKSVDYYSDTEIDQLRDVLQTLHTQNVQERMNAVAESYLQNGCCNSAIRQYSRILQSDRDYSLPGIFYTRVFHNLGVAYAKLFLYREAAACFREAFRLGQHEESYQCCLTAEYLSGQNSGDGEDRQISEKEYVMRREIETWMDNARYSEAYRHLDELDKAKEEAQIGNYAQETRRILEKWKQDYLHYTS